MRKIIEVKVISHGTVISTLNDHLSMRILNLKLQGNVYQCSTAIRASIRAILLPWTKHGSTATQNKNWLSSRDSTLKMI